MGRIGNIGRNGRVDAKKVKLCILLAGCAFLLLAVLKTEYKERDLSQWNDAYLGADEAIQMLTFSGYEKSEWEELLDMKQDRELKFVDVKNWNILEPQSMLHIRKKGMRKRSIVRRGMTFTISFWSFWIRIRR